MPAMRLLLGSGFFVVPLVTSAPVRGTFKVIAPFYGEGDELRAVLTSGAAEIGSLDTTIAYQVDVSALLGTYSLSRVAASAVMVSPESASVTPVPAPDFVQTAAWTGSSITVICGSGAQVPGAYYILTLALALANVGSIEETIITLTCPD